MNQELKEQLKKIGDEDFYFDRKPHTAEELGEKPVYCPICGKEKMWGLSKFFGQERHVIFVCKCEEEQDRREREEMKQREKDRQRNAEMSVFREMSYLPARAENQTFENWTHIPEAEECFEHCRTYAEDFTRTQSTGLCLYGDVGCGKTYLTTAIYHILVFKGFKIVFQNVPELLTTIRNTYGKDYGYSEQDILDCLIKADILILDDLGSQKPTEWSTEMLYKIVNGRYEENKPIIVTANANGMKGLKEYVDKRIYDRLIHMCIPVGNPASSFRRLEAIEREKERRKRD